MKKVLLIGFVIFCIFQMIVMATAIDIGSAAIDRGSAGPFTDTRTYVDQNNPANASGTITSVEIFANAELSNCEVATFYVVSGNNLSTRDTHTIGTVAAGSKQTFSGLNITVVAGDYIGICATAGEIDRVLSGDGYWLSYYDKIPCVSDSFEDNADRTISLYGTGATPSGITWNTVTISKWNTATISKWNGM